MTKSQLGTTMPMKEREEPIPSLLTDACLALRAWCGGSNLFHDFPSGY